MKRGITITAAVFGISGVVAIALYLLSSQCGSWTPFGCRGADPELTGLMQ